MIELQDKLGDILDNLKLPYEDFLEDSLAISAIFPGRPHFFDVFDKVNKSFYAERMSIARNQILLRVPTTWVKSQRYTIVSYVHFEFSSGFLNKIYIKPVIFRYTNFQGKIRNFSSFNDLINTMSDDSRLNTIESMGVLDDSE